MPDCKCLTNGKYHHPDLLFLWVCRPPSPSARPPARVSRSLLPRCPHPPGHPPPFHSVGVNLNLTLPRSSLAGLSPPLRWSPQQGCLPVRHHKEWHLFTNEHHRHCRLWRQLPVTRTGTKLTAYFSYSDSKMMTALDSRGIIFTKGYSNSITVADLVILTIYWPSLEDRTCFGDKHHKNFRSPYDTLPHWYDPI